MGTSLTRYKDFGFWTSDSLLEVWLYLLAQEIDRLDTSPHWLMELRRRWYFYATFGGTGIIDPGLDECLNEDERVIIIIQLSERALEWLREHGPVLSKEMLNSWNLGGPGSYFVTDANVEAFVKVGTAFVQLLKGELKTDLRSTFVY